MVTRDAAAEGSTSSRRAQDADRNVGLQLRKRRIMLGLTQQQMAKLIGVTYQQANKYEQGVNRISAGRLYQLAKGLGVEANYFYDGLDAETGGGFKPTQQQRQLLELVRNFTAIPGARQRQALCDLARALAIADATEDAEDGHTAVVALRP